MKGLIVNVMVGAGLFAGALVAGLVATGRWSHEGTANIPVVNALFPAPQEADDGAHASAADAAATGHGEPQDGSHSVGQEPERERRPLVVAPSLFAPAETKGGGHGEPAAQDGGHGNEAGATAGHGPAAGHAKKDHGAAAKGAGQAEHDFAQLADSLHQNPDARYSPGAYFRFDGMPAGVTPDQLNASWKRVQDGLAELERRGKALDQREQELREFSEDLARRQTEVGKERAEVEALQRRLDERIARFQDEIKLVRSDEAAALKRNAKTLESFEPAKAAELLTEQWKTEAGQVDVLKLLEFMDKEAVDQILAELPNHLVREVLQKRLRVVKEPAAPASGRK